jgi:RHS repeat-associated protein
VIVTTTVYDSAGQVLEQVDPKGVVTRYQYDAAGRQVAVIANYTGATPPLSSEVRSTDLYTRYAYENGIQTFIWVDMWGDDTDGLPPIGGNKQSPDDDNDQVTQYIYGTPKGTAGSGTPVESQIATGHLLRETIYPPGQASDTLATRTVSQAYNALGQVIWMKDQAGNITGIEYDKAGRETMRTFSTIANGTNSVEDLSMLVKWINNEVSDARWDLNADGSITTADYAYYPEKVLGRGKLSWVNNRIGYAGYQHAPELAGTKYHARHRALDAERGEWLTRDPAGFIDGKNLYQYARSRPLVGLDPMGLRFISSLGGSGLNPTTATPYCGGSTTGQMLMARGTTGSGGCNPPGPGPGPGPGSSSGKQPGLPQPPVPGCLKESQDPPWRGLCWTYCNFDPAAPQHPGSTWCKGPDGDPVCCVCDNIIRRRTGDDEAAGILVDCAERHEKEHMWQCATNDLRPEACHECSAYAVEYTCLANERGRCNTQRCRDAVDARMNHVARLMAIYCALCYGLGGTAQH